MKLKTIQKWNRQSVAKMKVPFRSGAEVMLALTEELGEIAKEVALLEQIGSKVEWERSSSVARLGEEMTHLLNLTFTLANLYAVDLESLYTEKLATSSSKAIANIATEDPLTVMANDPAIQRELKQIADEFA
jgi:NTP pyrophosphatase (non-canonical NTP hydrolase)